MHAFGFLFVPDRLVFRAFCIDFISFHVSCGNLCWFSGIWPDEVASFATKRSLLKIEVRAGS